MTLLLSWRTTRSSVPFCSSLSGCTSRCSNDLSSREYAARSSTCCARSLYTCRDVREGIVALLQRFFEHIKLLDDFGEGWQLFMRRYLRSVEDIVGRQTLVVSNKTSNTASVPTSFFEELESLRTQVEQLTEEVSHATLG